MGVNTEVKKIPVGQQAISAAAQVSLEERTESFARQFRLGTVRDACGDLIIPGKIGHLYFDGEDLCWAIVEGGPWNLKGILRTFKKHCLAVVDAEREAIFKGIPPEFWGRVVKQSGAAKIVRKQVCKSLIPHDATRPQICGAIS